MSFIIMGSCEVCFKFIKLEVKSKCSGESRVSFLLTMSEFIQSQKVFTTTPN